MSSDPAPNHLPPSPLLDDCPWLGWVRPPGGRPWVAEFGSSRREHVERRLRREYGGREGWAWAALPRGGVPGDAFGQR